MYRIRRFGVMKTATVVAIMYMLIVGVFVVPILLLALVAAPNASGSIGGIVVFGLLAVFGYGLLGWVFTAIAAAIYNLAARWVGGIEVEIEAVAPPPPLPAWSTSRAAPTPPPADPGSPSPTV